MILLLLTQAPVLLALVLLSWLELLPELMLLFWPQERPTFECYLPVVSQLPMALPVQLPSAPIWVFLLILAGQFSWSSSWSPPASSE